MERYEKGFPRAYTEHYQPCPNS
ncbi:hypothetical protein [Candidatus Finniella inopinata]